MFLKMSKSNYKVVDLKWNKDKCVTSSRNFPL